MNALPFSNALAILLIDVLPSVTCDSSAVLVASAGDRDDHDLVLGKRRSELHCVCDSVCRFDRRDDAFCSGQILECVAEVGLHAVEDSELARVDRCSRLKGIDTSSCSFAADEVYALIFDIVIERSDGIGTAAAACENVIRKASFLLEYLCLGLTRDNSLEISYDSRERMRTHYGT